MQDGRVWTDEESTSDVLVLGWGDDEDEEGWDEDLDWEDDEEEEEEEEPGEDWDDEEEEEWEEWEEEFEDEEEEDPFGRRKPGRPQWD